VWLNIIHSNINPIRADVLSANLYLFLIYQIGPLRAAILYLGLAKVGAYYNYWIESAATGAVLATRAIWSRPVGATATARFIATVGGRFWPLPSAAYSRAPWCSTTS
jgi:hypothetical protein